MENRGFFVHDQALVTRTPEGELEVLNQNESHKWLKAHDGFGIRLTERLAKIQLVLNPANDQTYKANIVAITRTSTFEISLTNLAQGYFIANDTWVPIDNDSITETISLLGEGGIHDLNRITYPQSLYLKVQGNRLTAEVIFSNEITLAPPSEGPPVTLLDAKPYPYQEEGFRWLRWLSAAGVGGILGDEMGLGKTLQVIMLSKYEIQEGRWPNLIVCPSSLLENWRREFKKFVGLDVYVHHGVEKKYRLAEMQSQKIAITSYDAVRHDELVLGRIKWNLIAADEAQYIKNADSQRHRSIAALPKRFGLAVTGTPIENRLMDLWSIADFVIPGVLRDPVWFKERFLDNESGAERLREVIEPLLMRREVKDVAKELPELTYKDLPFQLPPPLFSDYSSLLQEASRNKSSLFEIATKLRVLAAHALQDFDSGQYDDKFEYLRSSLLELMESGKKAIIFTPFNRSLELIAGWFRSEFPGYFVRTMTGETPVKDRQSLIDEFTTATTPGIVVMNAKVGGVGLNITAANHVFHFSPDWNPAVMDQASARSYRRGQTLPVTIHNMFYMDTIEEYMIQRLEAKRHLSETALREQDQMPTPEELLSAMKRIPRSESDNV